MSLGTGIPRSNVTERRGNMEPPWPGSGGDAPSCHEAPTLFGRPWLSEGVNRVSVSASRGCDVDGFMMLTIE